MTEIMANVVGGVIATGILALVGWLVARWYAPKRRELMGAYGGAARKALGLSNQTVRDLLRDRDVQTQLLSPIVGLEQEWAVLVDELRQRGGG